MFWTVETARKVLQTKSFQHCCPMQTLAQRLTKPIREFNQSFCGESLPEARFSA
jgi:hypothetical protein